MAISEAQLETWSHQGQTGQFTATYETLKGVLHDRNAPYAARSFDSFLQGSYANDTNVHGDSDVDIVISTDEVYYSDTSQLGDEDLARFKQGWTAATYTLDDFKRDVASWLTNKYGNSVVPGAKALFVAGNGVRRDADVIVAAEFRRYHRFSGRGDPNDFTKGICFFNSSGTRIENFPKLHSANCTSKHQATKSWFKPTARIHKNLRNTLVAKGLIADGLAPSYFIEGLLYNVPPDRFGGTEVANFTDTFDWLASADREKFVCANEQFYLLNDSSPVTWTAAKCTTYLNAIASYWRSI
jgi:hypothetical protein